MKTKMTKSQKRVLIAKDVIKHLKAKKICANHGYCCLSNETPYGVNAKTVIEGFEKPCRACALGSMFLAHILRFNEVKTRGFHECQFSEFDIVTKPLLDYFSRAQLNKIEGAYEGERIGALGNCAKSENRFFDKHPYDKERILAIMKNIIKNGIFKP